MRRRPSAADARAVTGVALWLLLLTVISWRKWGNPELDPGNDLTVADLVAHGSALYRDVRYFYGPVGIGALALAFKAFGTSFTVAFAFGYAQTIAILAAFYAVARNWLRATAAGLATAGLAAIGFSGSLFDFVLPHTNAATFGLLFALLELLALTRRRLVLAGLAAGMTALTRPEFAGFAVAIGAGAAAGIWREEDWRAALRAALTMLLPAIPLTGAVLGAFAASAGLHTVLFENIVPVDFLHVAGFRFQQGFAPYDVPSAFALALRGYVYLSLLAGLVGSTLLVRRGHGVARWLGLWPLGLAVASLAVIDGGLRVTGIFPGSRHHVERDSVRLLLGMSWLPLAALGAGIWSLVRLRRGGAAPLSGAWPADLALIAGAVACALRAYNVFTTDVYSTYYAAPPLLVAVIFHQQIADRWPQARAAAFGAVGFVAITLAAHAYVGLYSDHGTLVRTVRGTFNSDNTAAPAIQHTVDFLRAHTRPGDPVLVVPDDPGIHFMADVNPALYELTFLPGTLDSTADERRAISRLRRQRPRFVVIGARRFDQYGFPVMGIDYNRLLIAYVHSAYRSVATYGDFLHPPRNAQPARAFRIYELRGAGAA